jgi:hypothetical protein
MNKSLLVFSFIISVLLVGCSSSSKYTLSAQEKFCSSQQKYFNKFDPVKDTAFNLGEIEGKIAIYQPKPEGGSRQTVRYEDEDIVLAYQKICNQVNLSQEEYQKMRVDFQKMLKSKASPSNPYALPSPSITTWSSQARDDNKKPEGFGYSLGYSNKSNNLKTDPNHLGFFAKYITIPTYIYNGVSFEAKGTNYDADDISIQGDLTPGQTRKDFICQQLNFVRDRLRLGTKLTNEVKIPSCKQLFADSNQL